MTYEFMTNVNQAIEFQTDTLDSLSHNIPNGSELFKNRNMSQPLNYKYRKIYEGWTKW